MSWGLACATAIQTAFAERNEATEEPINVRIGLNAGEPVAEDEDLIGTAVQLLLKEYGLIPEAKGIGVDPERPAGSGYSRM